VSYTDIKQVRETYVTLRELVIHHPGGWDDVAARLKVDRLCEAAMRVLDDAECCDRLCAVRAQASELYSREAHLKWGRASMRGADYLRLQMLIALEALRTRLFFIEATRNRGSFEQPDEDLTPV
jgi:hypothetical protein